MPRIPRLSFSPRSISTLAPKHTPIPIPFAQIPSIEENPNVDVYFQNIKINDLINFGSLNAAIRLFDEMPHRDVVTYNMLISAHGRSKFPDQALLLYNKMVSHGIRESSSTFSSVLSICANAGYFREGIQVHCRVIHLGICANLFVASSLIDLYMHKGEISIALKMFYDMYERNLAIWNVVLRGLCELGRQDELLGMYSEMKLECVEPNGLTFCYLIRGCGNLNLCDEGKQLHCHVIKVGWVESNLFVANALVDFYSASGSLIDAKKSFLGIPVEDVISWNSIVSACVDQGLLFHGLEYFARMQFWGKRPSIRSFVGLLNLSSRTADLLLGKQMHCYVVKMGFDLGSVYVQSALIDMYGKCGLIEDSLAIFENCPPRNLEICNSLMSSLLHCGITEDVIGMLGLVVDEGFVIDEVTLSMVLKALSASASPDLVSCRELHCCAIKFGFESNMVVSSSLIEAYSRSGDIKSSEQVLEELPSPNIICLTSIISGYARDGMGKEALSALEAMIQKDMKPDRVAFLCALSGCNHSGLVAEGRWVFNLMTNKYGIYPERQHYSCMIDLLGRAGLLEEAENVLKQSLDKGNPAMWSSLLRSCRVHGNERIGRRAVETLMELHPEDPALYLQAASFYSQIGEFEISMQIREIAIARKLSWDIGHSLIEEKWKPALISS